MKLYSFEKDAVFYVGEKRHVVVRKIADPSAPDDYQGVQICYEDMTGMFGQSSVKELLAKYAVGELRLGEGNSYVVPDDAANQLREHKQVNKVSDGDKDNALWKIGYIQAVLNNGPWKESEIYLYPIISDHAIQTGDMRKPGVSTVRKWHRRWKANDGDWKCLLPRHDRKGNREPRFTEEEISFYEKIIHREYMTGQRRSVVRTRECLLIEIRNHNITNPGRMIRSPSKATIYRMISDLSSYDKKLSRYGRHAANIEFRQGQVAPQPSRVMEIAEIDHTPVDIEIVCRKTGLVLGTPWLTIIIDGYSRMVLGFYVSFDPPSVQSVAKALEHSINPKTYLKEKYPFVMNDWPTYGRMATLVCDNGAEFHANELERMALMMGVIMQFCPSRVPYFKGKVERFFGTLSRDLIHDLPGTTFSTYEDRGDYQSEKKAVITLETLNAIIHKWIIDIYHQKIHGTTNERPIDRWKNSAMQFPPQLPHSAALINHQIYRITLRKLRVGGVEVNSITYNSDALWQLRKRIGNNKKVEVRFDHEDLSKIYVTDPESGDLLEAQSTVHEYTVGLSFAEHKAIQKFMKEKHKSQEDVFALINARMEIEKMVHEDTRSRSKAKRRETARKTGLNSARLQSGKCIEKDSATHHVDWAKAPENSINQELPSFEII